MSDAGDDALARELIGARQERGSMAMTGATLVIIAVGLLFLGYIWIAVDAELAWRLTVVVVLVGVYQLILRWWFRRGGYRPWIDWVNGTLEVSIVTLVMVIDAEIKGPAYALTSAPTYLYPAVILASAVRLRRALSLYTGVLAAASYLAVFIAYRHRLPPELVTQVASFETWNVIQRASFFVFAGFVAYVVCVLMRRSVQELVASVRKQLQVERTLGRHVSREVADLLVGDDAQSIGEERDLTVMFVDVRRFTTFSETRAPSEVVAFLNDYFEVAAGAIERHGGIVNKFTGDGLMALFGAPAHSADHPAQAARAALSIVDGLDALRARWKDPSLRVGVGVHTGRAVVGTIGTESRAEYTAIGDAVNVAARVEELNKELGTEILVTSDVADHLDGEGDLCARGEFIVRGRTGTVTIYELRAM